MVYDKLGDHWQMNAYVPTAIYFEEADSVEYVRKDVPCVYRRVDDLLTLILDMDDRQLIGFKIKGFRNFYIRHRSINHNNSKEFLSLMNVIQKAARELGDDLFKNNERGRAYEQAGAIAREDRVTLQEFPEVA
ncbi:hypothetical protein MWN33_12190 [Starkeya koreensis]|uniref:Uncharacterized protein n=1 Tax=Ancylobacter koreensis TaxID=266121 RepID=A0ABT0DNJ6_9HYPH|nr:hypothetical protein [Ancylobacter koreensis]MCK0208789.1 hypothetical protein [Ancylobacter koreensis]